MLLKSTPPNKEVQDSEDQVVQGLGFIEIEAGLSKIKPEDPFSTNYLTPIM